MYYLDCVCFILHSYSKSVIVLLLFIIFLSFSFYSLLLVNCTVFFNICSSIIHSITYWGGSSLNYFHCTFITEFVSGFFNETFGAAL